MKTTGILTGNLRQSGAPQINQKHKRMKRLTRLACMLLACCSYLCTTAQTTIPCSAEFTYSVGANKVVTFYAKDTLYSTNRWLFGDGSAAVVTSNAVVTHQYAQPGEYEVKHFIEKPNYNCKDSVVKKIIIPNADTCHAGFEWQAAPTVPPGISPYTFLFKNTSLAPGGIHSASWKFGDGGSSNDLNPTHAYSQPGNYQVCLRIETNAGCISELCQLLVINKDSCNITAKYEWKKDSLDCKTIHFINLSTSASANIHYSWKFGDGSSSQDINPVHVYTAPGKYYVCLVSESGTNCRKEYCDSVNVVCENACNITARYEWKKDSADCRKIHFINLSTPVSPNVHFSWKFGDGSSSQDINPVHVYNQPGKYYVCLVSEAGTNCRKEYCDSVTVVCETSCNISAKFEYRKDSLDCKTIHFINLSSPVSPNIRFAWKFGDGDGSYDANPTHVYKQTGKYQVCLVVDAGNNCTKYFCDSVIVRCEETCNIQPSFSWKSDLATPNKIFFQNTTLSPVAAIHYTWKFGDDSYSNDLSPVHVYQNPGTYTVCLIAEINNSCRKEYCQQVEVKSCNVFAKFETRHDSTKWNTIHFSNTSQPVGNIWRTYWYYGDGSTSQDFNSYHSYDKPGVYQVCLKVISLDGCTSSYCDSVKLVKPDTCAGKARYAWHNEPTSPLTVKFEALYQNNTAKYYWSFGDGAAGTERNTYHVYHKSGVYKVCLTVKDGDCLVTNCEELTVGSNCDTIHIKYEYTPKPNRPNEITFKAISNEPLVSQVWYIYKLNRYGATAAPIAILQQDNPTYLFRDTAKYLVCLKGVSASLCHKEYCEKIYVATVINTPGRLVLSPNPAISTVSLDVTLDRPEQVYIRILDGSGAVKAEYGKNGVTGNNRFTLPVERLSQGIYLVEMKTNTRVWFSRFQKG
jgi:PKD repeat protein